MKQKIDMRQKRLTKVQQLKQELEKQNEAPAQGQSKMALAFQFALRKQMFKMENEAHANDNSELLKRLRDWNDHKHDYQIKNFTEQAGFAGMADLDENQIKIMIIKLQQIEKLLKEVGSQRKKKAKNALEKPKNNSRRPSVASTMQAF